MTIIIFPSIPFQWDFMKQRPQQLMIQFAQLGYRVYFHEVNKHQKYQQIFPGIIKFGNYKHFLKRHLPKKRQDHKVVVWTHNPTMWKKVKHMNPDLVIFDCIDDFPERSHTEKHMAQIADHIVCTSQILYDRIQDQFPNKRISLIRNGADSQFISQSQIQHPKPSDLPSGIVVGYVGAWSRWIDHELVQKCCQRFPHISFVVLGAALPIRNPQIPTYSYPNLHFLGHKPHHELIAYLQHFQIATIPFKYHPITLATNPVKAYEYLACGLPILSTAIPECIRMEPLVRTATSHQQYLNILHKMIHYAKISSVEKQERKNYVKTQTWEERSKEAHQLINSYF